jgi:hypothetical protein
MTLLRAIHADYQNKHAPISFIYWGIFKRTELGFAPYTHEHFHEWKTFASYVVANAQNLKNGQFIGRSRPSLFSASILPGEGDDCSRFVHFYGGFTELTASSV